MLKSVAQVDASGSSMTGPASGLVTPGAWGLLATAQVGDAFSSLGNARKIFRNLRKCDSSWAAGFSWGHSPWRAISCSTETASLREETRRTITLGLGPRRVAPRPSPL